MCRGYCKSRVAYSLAFGARDMSESCIAEAKALWRGRLTSVAEFGSRVAGFRNGAGGLKRR